MKRGNHDNIETIIETVDGLLTEAKSKSTDKEIILDELISHPISIIQKFLSYLQ